MSLRSDLERDRIYNEMDRSFHTSAGGIFSKLLSIALFLAIGFSAGSIYTTFSKADFNKLNTSNTLITSSAPVINSYSSPISSLSDIVAKTADSVVEITEFSTATTYFNSSYTSEGNGSGVIISADGYILTNNHVINNAEKITVRLRNGKEYEASLVGQDSKTDIAVIKIDATGLSPATIGDSSKTRVGDFVLAIGNPLGKLGGTVTYGYVSALEREIGIDGSTMNLMQFDAAVNPGNSGGGLFNSNGELIGVVNAKSTGYSVEGIGFAIPVNDVRQVIEDILTHGYATNRPYLGVSLSNSSYTSRNSYGSIWDYFYQTVQYGATVNSILENSPAEKAGIQKGDIIISIDGKVVSDKSDVNSEIAAHEVGDEIEIGIIRENRTRTVKATLEEYKGQ